MWCSQDFGTTVRRRSPNDRTVGQFLCEYDLVGYAALPYRRVVPKSHVKTTLLSGICSQIWLVAT